MKRLLYILLLFCLNLPMDSFARSDRILYGHQSNRTQNVIRNSHGRIKRSATARREFMRETGYPHGRPGYIVDHIVALKRGGKDAPSNMQWQTKSEAKAKDKWE